MARGGVRPQRGRCSKNPVVRVARGACTDAATRTPAVPAKPQLDPFDEGAEDLGDQRRDRLGGLDEHAATIVEMRLAADAADPLESLDRDQ